ncbi:MAG: tyrosine-type recombinase/integrase [Erythrobacter sp.]|uniref:tyrosine-type recombinase/integrase n=1 Tax=Erythrobacter sp. TaxID=1042 RepID=UPI00262CD413|nr:site-specific integrase [Erythrobacter sp.]MDJ0979248.1 tyrosine-type recombinase/integrase [Erythrobacter sp.]
MAIRKREWTAPNGTEKQAWLVDYRDQAGKRRFKQFARKKDAEAYELSAQSEVRAGVHTADSASITVGQAADNWLASVRALDREPTTVAAYEQHVRLHIKPKCGGRKLSQLTAPMVRTITDEWLDELSRPMAVRVLRSLKALITTAQERGQVAQNVALAVKLAKSSKDRGKVQIPSKAVLRAILKAADGQNHPKGRALVYLALYSGMRASELRGLSWSGVDLQAGKVEVYQRADAKGRIGPPKSASGNRTIGLPSAAVKALKEWKLACPSHGLDLVFPSDKGKVISHRGLMQVLEPVQQDAQRVTMHDFRHAAASLWIERGLNPKRVQYLMGHGSIQVTFDTYGHLFETEDADADAMEAALFAET